MKVRVTNIQRMCFHDGPGIRTTVFFKGCNLNCPWCSNPENISFDIEKYNENDIEKQFGKDISLEELEQEILKDKLYFKTNGGVTFSGGEPLLQFEKIETLLINLKRKNINICIETALSVDERFLDIALKYVDEYYVDIKILNEEKAHKVLNINLDNYYKNLQKLFSKTNNIVFRIPLSNEYTLTSENIEKIILLLKKYSPKKVEIFELHTFAEKKYKVLDRQLKVLTQIEKKKLNDFYSKIKDLNISVEIIKI